MGNAALPSYRYPGSWLLFFVVAWHLWQHQVSVATITFVQSNIRKAFLCFHCLLCSLAIGDLSRQQHVIRVSVEVVFGWHRVWGGFLGLVFLFVFFFLLSLKIMFEWLREFIFSWYSVVFHPAVSNLRLRLGFGFFFSASVPLKAIL